MAAEYTTNKIGDKHEICRNGELVATYTVASGTTIYAGDGKKYAVPISKQIKSLEGVSAPPADEPAESNEVVQLKQYVESLKSEVQELKRQLAGENTTRVPDRYKGVPIDHPDAPPMDPRGGLITPAYLDWARSGGFTEEQFIRVYKGKIKDLSYPKK